MWGVARRCAPSLKHSYSVWCGASIEASEYVMRRHRLVERIRQAAPKEAAQRPVLIITRSAKEQFSAPDVPYPFRQCSYFRYLSGLPLADVVLTVVAQPNDQIVSTLYFDGRTAHEELWQGPAMTADQINTVSGIQEVKQRKHLTTDLEKWIPSAVVSFDLKDFPTKSGELAEILARFGSMVPVREHIDRLRWVKSKREQELMRATCDIGARAMSAMIARSMGVRNENEIVGRLEMESRRRGAAHLAYPPVVAAAHRANIIHYLDSNQVGCINIVPMPKSPSML
ncbi:unnamed protein product [Toxocara canis]|nr:unnamed protein product [Toxocara canis]